MITVLPVFSVRELGLDYQVPVADPINVVPPDLQRPAVTITLPANGTTVSGTINLVAIATDNVAIANVRFTIDGETFGVPILGPGPYTLPWDTTPFSDGGHEIIAVATDTSGNQRVSAAVDVTIDNVSLVAVSLNNLLWVMPNTGFAEDGTGICTDPADVVATLRGRPEKTYNVTLRFRGVVEIKEYTGGTADGHFYTGGAGANPGDLSLNTLRNLYEMDVSSPTSHYFFNAFTDTAAGVFALDYTKTIPMQGGSTITLKARSEDNFQFANPTHISVTVGEGDPPILVAQPFDGQWIQMNVVSISEA